MTKWAKRIQAKSDEGRHSCEAGYCQSRACVDFGSGIRVPGIPGEVRFLCCQHARGIKGHLTVHTQPQPLTAAK